MEGQKTPLFQKSGETFPHFARSSSLLVARADRRSPTVVKDTSISALCRTYGLPDARFAKPPKTRQLAGWRK
jgi:hypothetical protein